MSYIGGLSLNKESSTQLGPLQDIGVGGLDAIHTIFAPGFLKLLVWRTELEGFAERL